MYLDPHEELLSGHDEINNLTNEETPNAFYFSVVQGTVLTKEIRLWNNGLRFENPVYETVKGDGTDTGWLVLSNQYAIDFDHRLKLIEEWRKAKPLAKEPFYYQALTALLKGNYPEFTRLAEYYLDAEKQGMSATMLRYYLAMVQAYELDRLNEAARNTLICISAKPIMAEFWCLLGDIQYRLKNYQKAVAFYENAVILGSRRLKSDLWPMDISKYKEYPMKMSADAQKIVASTKLYHRVAT
jgi:tetratricopeptide (TPR) repeat protein